MDKTDFISDTTKITPGVLNQLWLDLQTARSNRGWANGSWTAPSEVKYKRSNSASSLEALKSLVHYNGQGPRYVNNFPAYTTSSGNKIRSNFLNEIQLAINDIKNGVGCSSGCTGICVGCSGNCAGSNCSGTCGNQCSGGCGEHCYTVCSGECGGGCSSGCSDCTASCQGGSD